MKHSFRKRVLRFIGLAILLLYSRAADATPLTFTSTPDGLTFAIENLGPVEDLFPTDGNPNDTYAILLTLSTTTGYADAGDPDLLAALAIHVSASDLNAATLAGPEGYTWALKSSETVPGNSAKCHGNDPGGLCVEQLASSSGHLALDAANTYSWLFHLDLGADGFADSTRLDVTVATLNSRKKSGNRFRGAISFSAHTGSLAYNVPSDERQGQAPGDTDIAPAPVPEPGSLLLVGTGLTLMASRLRRKRT